MCASAQAENLARYLNGSHFRVCAAISQKLPSPCRQTDTYADRQADRLGGWVGRRASSACSTQGYVLPEVEN